MTCMWRGGQGTTAHKFLLAAGHQPAGNAGVLMRSVFAEIGLFAEDAVQIDVAVAEKVGVLFVGQSLVVFCFSEFVGPLVLFD